MAGKRDASKRLKGFGIPVEVCVKYERLAAEPDRLAYASNL